MIKTDENGEELEGPADVNTVGLVIHSAIYFNHPENHFVFHAHPPSAITVTVFSDGIPFLVQDSHYKINTI